MTDRQECLAKVAEAESLPILCSPAGGDANLGDIHLVLCQIRDILAKAPNCPIPGLSSELDPRYLDEKVVQPQATSGVSGPTERTTLFSEAIGQYLDGKGAQISSAHYNEILRILGNFEEYVGTQILLGGIRPRDVENYRKNLGFLATQTINHHMAAIHAFYVWAIRLGYATKNPAEGMKLKQKGKSCNARKAFSDEQIKKIFSSPQINPDLAMDRNDAKRWLPLIMLYTGARPEEVTQLRVGDIRQIAFGAGTSATTWVFDFTNIERAKNEASRRIVPVHPKLWDLDLHELRESALHGGGAHLLLPNLTGDRRATSPSRWFNNQLRSRWGISDPKLTLYSLRHTVATKLKHKGAATELIEQLLGHTTQSQATGRYGKEYPLEQMVELVGRLEW